MPTGIGAGPQDRGQVRKTGVRPARCGPDPVVARCAAPAARSRWRLAQARPFAVARQELGRVLGLGSAAEQLAAEADQAEVADEAAVVAAEAVEEERRDRPGAELALAQQAGRGAVGRRRHEALEVELLRDAHERGGAARRRGRWPRPAAAERRARPARSGESVRPACGTPASRTIARSMRRASSNVTSWPASPRHERMQAGALARRAQAAGAGHRAGQQVVALGHGEERRDVVVDARAGSAGDRARWRRRARRARRAATRRCAARRARAPGPAGVAKTSSAPSSSSRSVPSRTPPSVMRRL